MAFSIYRVPAFFFLSFALVPTTAAAATNPTVFLEPYITSISTILHIIPLLSTPSTPSTPNTSFIQSAATLCAQNTTYIATLNDYGYNGTLAHTLVCQAAEGKSVYPNIPSAAVALTEILGALFDTRSGISVAQSAKRGDVCAGRVGLYVLTEAGMDAAGVRGLLCAGGSISSSAAGTGSVSPAINTSSIRTTGGTSGDLSAQPTGMENSTSSYLASTSLLRPTLYTSQNMASSCSEADNATMAPATTEYLPTTSTADLMGERSVVLVTVTVYSTNWI